MLGFKLNRISKRGPWIVFYCPIISYSDCQWNGEIHSVAGLQLCSVSWKKQDLTILVKAFKINIPPVDLQATSHVVSPELLNNTVRLGRNGYHFANNILKLIFLYDNNCILIQIWLNLVARVQLILCQMSVLVKIITLKRWQAIIWTSDDPVHWCMYAK